MDESLKFRLGELKTNLIKEFGLRPINDFLWEKKRNEFLEKVSEITQKRSDESEIEEELLDLPEKSNPVVGKNDVGYIPVESVFLLVYAADGNGHINRVQSVDSSVKISTNEYQFLTDDSQRESAIWDEALDRLVEWGWVKPR